MTLPTSGTEEPDADARKRLAAELFNLVWTYLDKPDRTPEDDDRMLHAAHASRFHWGEVGGPERLARGEWQCSRVYCVLGRPEPAGHHARRCLQICLDHGIGDFDLAFAYEAMARSAALAGNREEARRYADLAGRAGRAIAEDEDREVLEADLATLPLG